MLMGDLVFLADDNEPPLVCKTGRTTKLFEGDDGISRVAEVKTLFGEFVRTTQKLRKQPIDQMPTGLLAGEQYFNSLSIIHCWFGVDSFFDQHCRRKKSPQVTLLTTDSTHLEQKMPDNFHFPSTKTQTFFAVSRRNYIKWNFKMSHFRFFLFL